MQEHAGAAVEVPGLFVAVVLVVLVTLGVYHHHARVRSARQVELRRLQVALAAENERVEKLAEEEYNSSMLATRNTTSTQSLCAVCDTPTNTRCSRCKSIHYCSSQCQLKHWKEGHKAECRAPKAAAAAVPLVAVQQTSRKVETGADGPSAALLLSTRSVPVEVKRSISISKAEVCNVTPDGCFLKPKKKLFPYARFVQYFNWDIRRPPCGLINCGNSCFANVILQCLTYTRPLAAYLLEGSHRKECRRNDWCFMCELQEHAHRVYSIQNPFSPFRILSRLRDIGNHLGYGRQEDAHEFMRFAVDSMQSICLDPFGGEKMVDPRSQQTTLIQYIFGGHLRSQVKCMNCGHESNRYENMMDLAVEIQGAVESLEDGLAQFTAPECLDGENKYKCDRCNGYVKASKRLTIHEAPNILTIALKRFQSGKFGKLNKRVTFPEGLNMSPYMSGEGDKPPLYRLYAVVVHVDMLNASFFGHYICYVRDTDGSWYKVDDSKVKEVDAEKVMSQKAYMLMYTRSSARPSPEAAAGSVASSLMDVSVSEGRECSSSSCKYQRSSSVGQIHGEVHHVSPIVSGTFLDNPLIEDSVGRSYSTLQSSAIERVIDMGGYDEPSISDSNTGSSLETDKVSSPAAVQQSFQHELAEVSHSTKLDQDAVKNGKRRLESEELCRTRSSSCPPVRRSTVGNGAAHHQLADDLPRSFGYSLCRRDSDADEAPETPSKRLHVLQANGDFEAEDDGAASAMDVDSEETREDGNVAAVAAAANGNGSLACGREGTPSSSISVDIGEQETSLMSVEEADSSRSQAVSESNGSVVVQQMNRRRKSKEQLLLPPIARQKQR